MLICADCVNYFLQCSVSNYPTEFGLCELCGNKAHCYNITIPEDKTKKGSEIQSVTDIIREAMRQMYYPDFNKKDGLQLAEFTVEKLYSRTTEEFAKYMLNKEVKKNDKKTIV